MIEIILAFLIGILIGTFCGLVPGIHTNLAMAIVLSSFVYLANVSGTSFIVFIVAMAITQSFVDFIPSIFLGAPNEDTSLVTLPGHKFLVEGYGHTAVQLTVVGSIISVILLVFIIPIFIILIPLIHPFIQKMMAFFLIWISIFMIAGEKESKIITFLIFVLAGFLGISTLNLELNEPLLPLLTGLFGSSTLIYAIGAKTIVPKQIIEKIKISKKDLIKPTLATTIVSPLSSFFPGLGSSEAAIIGSSLLGKLSMEQFLILLGSISTLVMSVSFTTLFLIQKSRTGAANAIAKITEITSQNFGLVILVIFLTSLIAIPLTLSLSKLMARNIHKVPYSKISFLILIFLTVIVVWISGLIGLIIFVVSTLLGLTCTEFGVRKGFLMGSLLIPTILFYFPF